MELDSEPSCRRRTQNESPRCQPFTFSSTWQHILVPPLSHLCISFSYNPLSSLPTLISPPNFVEGGLWVSTMEVRQVRLPLVSARRRPQHSPPQSDVPASPSCYFHLQSRAQDVDGVSKNDGSNKSRLLLARSTNHPSPRPVSETRRW